MSTVTTGIIILFGTLFLLICLRIPIAFSLGIAAVVSALYLDIPLLNIFMKMVTSMQSFVIIAAPFFIVMAQIMCDGGVTKKLMNFCNLIVGRIRGGSAVSPAAPPRTFPPSALCSSPQWWMRATTRTTPSPLPLPPPLRAS